MTDLPDVRPGDVWKDNDPRGGPTFRVVEICNGDTGPCQPRSMFAAKPHAHVTNLEGKRRRKILLRRFRPTRPGYTLVSRTGTTRPL